MDFRSAGSHVGLYSSCRLAAIHVGIQIGHVMGYPVGLVWEAKGVFKSVSRGPASWDTLFERLWTSFCALFSHFCRILHALRPPECSMGQLWGLRGSSKACPRARLPGTRFQTCLYRTLRTFCATTAALFTPFGLQGCPFGWLQLAKGDSKASPGSRFPGIRF